MTALSRLARVKGRDKPAVLLTTVNAALQRVPARDLIGKQALSAAPGNVLGMEGVVRWLELNGFIRASTVRESGDYAVRGGILDLFAPGMDLPVRLDFFGDTLETIRSFDPETQRTVDGDARARSRAGRRIPAHHRHHPALPHRLCRGVRRRRSATTCSTRRSAKAAAIPAWSTGCRCSTTSSTRCSTTCRARRWCSKRWPRTPRASGWRRSRLLRGAQGGARRATSGAPYKPLPPDRLYLPEAEWAERLKTAALARLTPFAVPDEGGATVDVGARAGPQFRRRARRERRRRVRCRDASTSRRCRRPASASSIALWSEGARERMSHVLAEHGLHNLTPVGVVAGGAGAAEAAGRARGAGARRRLRDRRRRRHQRAGHPRRPAGAAAARVASAPRISSPR